MVKGEEEIIQKAKFFNLPAEQGKRQNYYFAGRNQSVSQHAPHSQQT